ncbi:MAG: TolC family protein, partial [Balneolales bacterium]|nr:TolC family protein [Balneolales bacterium]
MNKGTISFLLVLAIYLLVNKGQAQTTMTLSLEESIEYAKENSPLSRAARYAIVSAKWRYRSFRADLLPTFSLTGNAPNYNKSLSLREFDDGSTGFVSVSQSEASVALGIDQSILQTGGTLSLSSGVSRLGIFRDENSYEWQSTPLVVSLTQPLFQYNSLKWGNRTEPLLYRIAQKQYVEDMEEIAYTVTQAYFDVLLAKINIEVADFNVTVNDSIYNISQGRFQVGNIAENELLQSELEYRNAQASLTTAILQYQRSEETFKALLGIDDSVELEIELPPVAPQIEVDVDEAFRLAQENNSSFLEFELNEIIANRTYDQARRNAGFSATLRADYGLNQ